MTVYRSAEVAGNLEDLLDEAERRGAVRIQSADGKEYEVRPVQPFSPLDVPGVDLGLSAEEIVSIVRASRARGVD